MGDWKSSTYNGGTPPFDEMEQANEKLYVSELALLDDHIAKLSMKGLHRLEILQWSVFATHLLAVEEEVRRNEEVMQNEDGADWFYGGFGTFSDEDHPEYPPEHSEKPLREFMECVRTMLVKHVPLNRIFKCILDPTLAGSNTGSAKKRKKRNIPINLS